MNKKLKIGLISVGVLAVTFVAVSQMGKSKRNRNVESICETRVKWQTGDRKVVFTKPVINFVDTGSYLLYWEDLRVENAQGEMEQRKVMCPVSYKDGWDGSASFIDGEALRCEWT